MSQRDIVVVSFPKSGNTWAARLLGEVLNSPVMGWHGARPLAEEGLDRKGNYIVRQLHLHPIYGEKDGDGFIRNAWEAKIPNWNGEKVILVVRDPRDIAVSAFYYWELSSVRETLFAMHQGKHPFGGVGAYQGFMRGWLDAMPDIPIVTLYYEILHAYPIETIYALLNEIGISDYAPKDIVAAVEKQSFANKRAEIEKENDVRSETRPYGRTIQLKNMRKGVPGDWTNHFDYSIGALCDDLFYDMMVELGYIREGDHSWYSKLPRANNEP